MTSDAAPPSPYKALLKHARTTQLNRTATRRSTKAASAAAAPAAPSTTSGTVATRRLSLQTLVAAVTVGVAATVVGVLVWRRLGSGSNEGRSGENGGHQDDARKK